MALGDYEQVAQKRDFIQRKLLVYSHSLAERFGDGSCQLFAALVGETRETAQGAPNELKLARANLRELMSSQLQGCYVGIELKIGCGLRAIKPHYDSTRNMVTKALTAGRDKHRDKSDDIVRGQHIDDAHGVPDHRRV
jgi:hypothetical protein